MKSGLVLAVFAIFATGCSSITAYNFRLNSQPQGGVVEVDGVVVGRTPTNIHLNVTKRWVGTMNAPGGWAYDNRLYYVKCLPPPFGAVQTLVSQTKKVYITPGVTPRDAELFFDLTLEPIEPTRTINVKESSP